MSEIIIDEEFRFLLPALDDETYARLEEDLLKNGCRDALVLWNNILIDGYNRYSICTKHNIEFKTIDMEFDSREDVLIWIISNQVSRRNLTPIQLAHFRGVHYRAERQIVSNKSGKNQHSEVEDQNDPQPHGQTTANRLAKKYSVSGITIKRNSKMSEAIDAIGEVSPEAKRKLLTGAVRIDNNVLESLSTASSEEIADVAARIEDGSYEKQKPDENTVMNPFEEAILKISGELFTELKKQAKDGDSKELKTALRSYIIMLEDLYKKL